MTVENIDSMRVVTTLPRETRRAPRRSRRTVQRASADPRPSGRAWINGHEVGGTDPRFAHLAGSYD
jgi:hypothetical protein